MILLGVGQDDRGSFFFFFSYLFNDLDVQHQACGEGLYILVILSAWTSLLVLIMFAQESSQLALSGWGES